LTRCLLATRDSWKAERPVTDWVGPVDDAAALREVITVRKTSLSKRLVCAAIEPSINANVQMNGIVDGIPGIVAPLDVNISSGRISIRERTADNIAEQVTSFGPKPDRVSDANRPRRER
jgi:hypothetical protein